MFHNSYITEDIKNSNYKPQAERRIIKMETKRKSSTKAPQKRRGCAVTDGGSGVLSELLQNPCNIIVLNNSGTVVGSNSGTITTVENSPNYGSSQSIGNRHSVAIEGSNNVGNGENITGVGNSTDEGKSAQIVEKLVSTVEKQQQTIEELQQSVKILSELLAERNRELKK